MIPIEEAKRDLGKHLTDEQAIRIRNSLYELVETLLDDYIEKSWKNMENSESES